MTAAAPGGGGAGSGGRRHGPTLVAGLGAHPDPHPALDWIVMCSPGVGWWRASVAPGQLVEPGQLLGELTVLGVVIRVVAPAGARGRVVADADQGRAIAAQAGNPLLTLARGDAAIEGATAAHGAVATTAAAGLTIRAPSSGRFYGRPAPGKPAFVSAGDVIRDGHTVCLLEVMKTFHRVTYGGDGLPPQARVVSVAVADEADVNRGDVLLDLEAVS